MPYKELNNPFDYPFNNLKLLDFNIRKIESLIEAIDRTTAKAYTGDSTILEFVSDVLKPYIRKDLLETLNKKINERDIFLKEQIDVLK